MYMLIMNIRVHRIDILSLSKKQQYFLAERVWFQFEYLKRRRTLAV